MPRQSELITKRNEAIRKRFAYHRKKNPKWTITALIDTVSGEFYLSSIMIVKILRSEESNLPAHSTLARQQKKTANPGLISASKSEI